MAAEDLGPAPADQTDGDRPTFAELSAALAEAPAALLDDHAFRMQVITHLPKTEVKQLVDMYGARRKYLNREAYLAELSTQPKGLS